MLVLGVVLGSCDFETSGLMARLALDVWSAGGGVSAVTSPDQREIGDLALVGNQSIATYALIPQ